MISIPVSVPENVTFEEAIGITQRLLSQIEAGDLSEAEIKATIGNLVQTQNGARGFFVTYLSDPRSLADRPSEAIIHALESSGEIVAELMVKNAAMSSAMVVHHRRNQNEEMAASSERVRSRSVHLIQALNIPSLQPMVQQLIESAKTGVGDYQSFLERWGYDAEQREAIVHALASVSP